MIKRIWNYLKGYVIIEIIGFSIERFLNLCLNKNVNIVDLKDTSNGVLCKINIKDFKLLKDIARKTGCKYKILKKTGAYFFIFKNRKRGVFFISFLAFIFLLYFFSFFVWSIDIIGTNNIDSNKILKFCEKNNLYVGALKKNIEPKKLQSDIKNHFDSVSWVSIQLEGTKVKIKLSENIIKDEKNDKISKEHTDIVADEDCVITEIITRSGTPLVRAGDVVKKGDILVSGELLLKEGDEIKGSYATCSDADIRAKVEEKFDISVDLSYNKKFYTGKSRTYYEILAFNKKIPLYILKNNVSYKMYDKIVSRKQLNFTSKLPLPFILKKIKYKEYIFEKAKYSIKEAKNVADKLITEKIIKDINFSSDIIEKSVSYSTSKDRLVAKVNLVLIKNIGKKAPVIIKNIMKGNDTKDGANKNTDAR